MKIDMKNREIPEQDNKFESFDGELLHPSLDIKNGVLVLGFRYLAKQKEERAIFVIVSGGTIQTTGDDSFKIKDKTYWLVKRGRKLMRVEEKWSGSALPQFIKD